MNFLPGGNILEKPRNLSDYYFNIMPLGYSCTTTALPDGNKLWNRVKRMKKIPPHVMALAKGMAIGGKPCLDQGLA